MINFHHFTLIAMLYTCKKSQANNVHILQDDCVDIPGWMNTVGETCGDYDAQICLDYGTCCDVDGIVGNVACCVCGGGDHYLTQCVDDDFMDCDGWTCEDYGLQWYEDDDYADDYENQCYMTGNPEDMCPDPSNGAYAVDKCCTCGGGTVFTDPLPAPSASPVSPTVSPTNAPTKAPSPAPTESPTISHEPTMAPTPAPTGTPTASPTKAPTKAPTPAPTESPTISHEPTMAPTPAPTESPTISHEPTMAPTPAPTESTATPSATPSVTPSATPSVTPSKSPAALSASPSLQLTTSPTASPTATPLVSPSAKPSVSPTASPSDAPVTTPVASPVDATIVTGSPIAATPAASGFSNRSLYHIGFILSVAVVVNIL